MGDQDERDRRGGDLPTWDGGRRAAFDVSYIPKLETVLMATFEKDDENDHWSAAQDRDPGSAANPTNRPKHCAKAKPFVRPDPTLGSCVTSAW